MSKSKKEASESIIAALVAEDTDYSDAGSVTSVGRHVDHVAVQDRLRAADMLVPGSALGPEAFDEYRRIKRPLLSNAFGKTASLVDRGNLIMVTSSLPGEGKTYTAVNLALSITHERDYTVLLVDCDVTRQGVGGMLGVSNKPGLVEVLENDDFSIGDALLATDVPELKLLCAGKQHGYVTELLASQRMSSLVDEMASRYDDRVIIFDSPPLLSTPQAQVLAALMGQIVFVIGAGNTPQAVVQEAAELIPEDKATGLVLNKSEYRYGRGGYYYGYYGSEGDKKK